MSAAAAPRGRARARGAGYGGVHADDVNFRHAI
jgi:hypothetical protein